MPRHATTRLQHATGHAQIDVGIADDIQALWDAGIVTFACCEGDLQWWRYVMLPAQDPATLARATEILGWVVTIKPDRFGYTSLRDR